MREIKFRAWHLKANRFFEWGSGLISLHHDLSIDCLGGPIGSENVILEQFTGLKDKNGIEIYEGDILQREIDSASGVVEFYYGAFVVSFSRRPKFTYSIGASKEMAVIANIHENPELLK